MILHCLKSQHAWHGKMTFWKCWYVKDHLTIVISSVPLVLKILLSYTVISKGEIEGRILYQYSEIVNKVLKSSAYLRYVWHMDPSK